jgi:Holliday junction resolvase RusA-like endonuclease
MIKLDFNITPVAKGRPRISSRGGFPRAYTPEKTRAFENEIKATAMSQYKDEPLTGPISCRINFYIPRPKSVSVKKRPYPVVGADLDNYIKSLLDGVQGVVFDNDAQVIEISASKKYSNEGAITLYVYEYNNDEE